MNSFTDLNSDNFILYAIKSYENPHCVIEEFEEDFKRIKFVNRLIKKYKRGHDLKERLILNHIIILYNVFGLIPATRMLFYRIHKDDHYILATFLKFLNYLPKTVYGIKGENILLENLILDSTIEEKLRNI